MAMRLKFDWVIVLENLPRASMVTDTTLEGPAGPRIIYVNSLAVQLHQAAETPIAHRPYPPQSHPLRSVG